MDFDELIIGPNPNQENKDAFTNELNNGIYEAMGNISDTTSEGSLLFNNGGRLYGYTKYIAEGGKIVGLKGDDDKVPDVYVGGYITLVGDSNGYVPSGHKTGDTVMVNRIIFPFFKLNSKLTGDDRIIEGIREDGLTGWLSPKNIDTELLLKSLYPERFIFERIDLPLINPEYKYGEDATIDNAINQINQLLSGSGGMVNLDEAGNKVSQYTTKKVLEIPKELPREIREKVIKILQDANLLDKDF